MGLDITVLRGIRRTEDYRSAYRLYANPDFAGRADGLRDGYYLADEKDGFRAGSYSGYNYWREQLAKLAGYKSAPHAWQADGGPFWELINFSDCEGVIGPKTAAKLAKDFAEHQAKADQHPSEHFQSAYATWRKAFEMAARDGAVMFH